MSSYSGYRRASHPVLIMLALAAQGCLTVENIAQRGDQELDSATPGAPETDGSVSEIDTGVEPAPSPAFPCLDRGTYQLEGFSVRGLSEACDGNLTCVEGGCVPIPECTEGVIGECVFRPSGTHGAVLAFHVHGSYAYWLEEGTYDGFKNYQNDGILARTKVGEWRREEVRTGLQLSAVRAEGEGAFFRLTSGTSQLLVGTDGSGPFDVTGLGNLIVADDGTTYSTAPKGNLDAIITVGRLGSTESSVIKVPLNVNGCGALTEEHLWCTHLASGEDGAVFRVDRAPPHAVKTFTPAPAPVSAARGQTLVAERLPWFAAAQVTEGGALTWKNVAGGTKYRIGRSWVGDDAVIWGRKSGTQKNAVLMRAKLDGTSLPPQVIAEVPEIAQATIDDASIFASSTGVFWAPRDDASFPGWLHYKPYPKQ